MPKIIGFKFLGEDSRPSLNLVPKKKCQILVDRDLADAIRRIAGALGYKSMSGLLNDSLIHFLSAKFPERELAFRPEDDDRDERERQE